MAPPVTPDASICKDQNLFDTLMFSLFGVFLFTLFLEIALVTIICIHRKKVVLTLGRKLEDLHGGQEYPYFALAYVYIMKKEDHLKSPSKIHQTHNESKHALANPKYTSKVDEINEQITRYFSLDNCYVESPYYGYNPKNKNFTVEEKKHRQNENVDVPDDSSEKSGAYECLNVGFGKKAVEEKGGKSRFSRVSRSSKYKRDDRKTTRSPRKSLMRKN